MGWWLRMFFGDANPRWASGNTSPHDVVTQSLAECETDGLLALRDAAYKFIDLINAELVKDGRGR